MTKSGFKFSFHQSKIISNIAWILIDRVFSTGVTFIIGVWLARYLNPEQYGTLRYVIAFVALFSPVASLGMSSILTRDLVEKPSEQNKLLGSACGVQFISGTFAACLAIVSIRVLAPQDTLLCLFVAIASSIFLFQPLTIVEQWFESRVESRYTILSKNISFVLSTILKVILIIYKAPLITLIFLLAVEPIIYSFALISSYHFHKQSVKSWLFNLSKAKYLIQESMPLVLTGLAVSIYLKIDQIMLGLMADKTVVGVYAVAASLSEIWFFIPIAFKSSLYPDIIKSKNLSKEVYQERLQKFYDLMAVLAYCIVIIFIPISHYLILSTYGSEYLSAVPILHVYIWNCIFAFQGIAQSAWLISEGFQQINFYSTASGAIINVFLNLLLIPRFGSLGAAIASLISYAFASYFCFLIFPQTRGNAMLMTKALLIPIRLPAYLLAKSSKI
ncbi:O-unit flippase [Dulcicalothrix desertica PCC 7102]|uniref:O-unit flippase n=1 Tax=Dulcicalothrix desertica PCC 7102 TaxID=232991 RepID=A0A3S1C7V7_9CYAN|nr:flippase [Dulcicalothrix desertica]RUS98506.1 O-unit flippase [Dulcicalothrix desertica PCC 7102]TWH54910.1 O-antigen/teichoic acid export membrane protein [Dulcicalothrix desertica PCC 7102]